MESTFVLSNLPFVPPTLSATPTPTPSSQPQPATIKLEDLETVSSMAASSDDSHMSDCGLVDSPSADLGLSVGEHKSSPKKRRSWGQVLPEPKTNLPPRKRAKTADEKEQRRIERVKRNRLAAHNSRERKRQEVEALQSEKQDLEHKLQMIQDFAEQQEAQLRYFRQMFPDAVAGAPFVAPLSSLEETLRQNPFESFTSITAVAAESSSGGHGSPCSQTLPASANATPDSLAQTLDTFSMPSTPCAETAPGADMTQHSAAMLWSDLQCLSATRRAPTSATVTSTLTAASPFSRVSAMVSILLILISMTLSSATSALISAFLTMSRFSPTRRTCLSSPRSQARQVSSNPCPRTTVSFPLTRADLLTACSPIRSPALAQQFLLATSLALRRPECLGSSAPSFGAVATARSWVSNSRKSAERVIQEATTSNRCRRELGYRLVWSEMRDDPGSIKPMPPTSSS